MQRSSSTRFSNAGLAIHWLTAVLVLVAFTQGIGGPERDVYSAANDFQRHIHETLGLCVLALVVIRVLWRLVAAMPPDPPQVARWMGLAAKLVQAGLYLLMFAVPLSAIAGAWLGGHPLTLLGGVEIAPALQLSPAAGRTIAEIHTLLGDAILWLAGLHAAAAIYHHLVLKDGVLASILPRWRWLERR